MNVRIRKILADDVQPIAKAAQDWLQTVDPDFDTPVLPAYCPTEESIMTCVRQRRDDDRGTNETRVYAVETTETVTVDGPDGPESEEVTWVCGGFAYELGDSEYDATLLAVHPSAPVGPVHSFIAAFLKGKTSGGKRREVRLSFRDAPEERLETVIPAWQREGFKFKLEVGLYGDVDGWVGTYRKP